MKLSKNSKCPCGSGKKYKGCCYRFHKGSLSKNALELMKSRYSAYAAGEIDYIIKTTHPKSPLFEENIIEWKKSIREFSKSNFKKLEILDFFEKENEAFVEFRAYIDDFVLHEKSRFKKEKNWLYYDGEFLSS
nr:YchJ family metal-binding protein [Nitrosophilus labii]